MRSARGLALLCGFLKNDEWVLTLSWGSKRIDTKVCPQDTKPCSHAVRGLDEYYPLETPVSFYLIVWRRPETGDRFEKEERQRIFPLIRTDLLRVRPFLLPIRSSVTLLLHISATLRRRDTR